MRTLLIPIQIDVNSGGLADTTDTGTIIEQQITDILVTNYAERLMAPEYGANLRAFLFSPARAELIDHKANDTGSLLRAAIVLADIVRCTMSIDPSSPSRILTTVQYRIKPGSEIFTFQHTVSGLVTEETKFLS